MSKNADIRKTKHGYTFLGLPDNYYLPTYEEALKEYNYRKNRRKSEPSRNKYVGASIKTVGGVQTDPKTSRRYVTQVRKQLVGKNAKLTKYTSNGDKSLNLKAGELLVQTGKYYLDTKTFIPDLVSVDPSYQSYNTHLTVSPPSQVKKQATNLPLPKKTISYRLKSKKSIKNKSKRMTNNSFIPKNDLSFISAYKKAYDENNQELLEAYNKALSKNPNKNLIWKGLWPIFSEANTPEKSMLDHEYLWTLHPGTRLEIGMTNWLKAYNGNTMLAHEGDLSKVSPEYKQWSTYTVNPQTVLPSLIVAPTTNAASSFNIDLIIAENADRFRSQYDYATEHLLNNNNVFDYAPSSFDTEGLNVNTKYGGIGDFMDTYGLSPQLLYLKLDLLYNQKKKNGGLIKIRFKSKW